LNRFLSLRVLGVRVLGFLRRDAGSCLLFFVVGLILRGVPELLVSWYPVGYETVTYYAPAMLGFAGKGLGDVFVGFFRAGPLFYVLMWLAANVSGAHPFLILKVVGPVLYGVLCVSFFVFLRRGLGLGWRLAFLASLLLVFQVAALRESWDRFRTVLGLVFVFGGLTALRSESRGKWGLLAVFGVLAALSREYVAVVLFVSVLGYAVLEKRDRVWSLLALVPGFAVFGIMVFPVLPGLWAGVVGLEFAVRGYLWVVQDAFVIFLVCYLVLLPFVLSGLRRDWLLGSMSVWLLVAGFSVVAGSFLSVPGYQRWLMLLVFPFCVYAVWGFERLGLFSGRRVWVLVAVFSLVVLVGLGYSSGSFSYVGHVPNSYVAVGLKGSSISWDQVDDVRAVLGWLDEHAVVDSAVLVEERFYGWTLLYLERAGEDVAVIAYAAGSAPSVALEQAGRDGFSRVYLVWFSGRSVDGFAAVFSWRAVSVFEFVGLV